MKKILIAGEAGKTANYENAMKQLEVETVTTLHAPSICGYDGLLLPGGGDIDPKLFGQLPAGTHFFDPKLDRLQLAVLAAFVQERKPVLGICKGMQLINVYFGGDMIQDIATAKSHAHVEADQIHKTRAVPDSFLAEMYGEEFTVNSAHHQAVDSPGKGIEYVQFAGDGVVEALHHKYLPVIGVQWHPERLCFSFRREDAVDGRRLLEYFVSLL